VNSKRLNHDELTQHPFTRNALETAIPVLRAENDYKKHHGRKSEYTLCEHDFYIMRVGNRISMLISHCEQLSNAIHFMTTYRKTAGSMTAGANRISHLRYNVENFIIRTQTLYDLVLKLVDAVFHLTNDDSQCRHPTIVGNLKVKNSSVPRLLKSLRRKLDEFHPARNVIVHGGQFEDKKLSTLELLALLETSCQLSGTELPPQLRHLPSIRAARTRELLKDRKSHYTRFTSEVIVLLVALLDELHKQFAKEKARLG
jgi:hypothetical protein